VTRGVKQLSSGALLAVICAITSGAASGATLIRSPLLLGVSQPRSARLEVVPSDGVLGLGYMQAPTDRAPTRIDFHVPDGFAFTPDANGAATGSVVGSDVIAISTLPPEQPFTGVLTIEEPATFAAEGLACTGSSTHDAVWAASVPAPTGAFKIPIFVDGRTFTICTDAARLGGTPTAIAFQLGLVSNSGINRPLVRAPSAPGRFVWSATVTRAGLSDVEIRSIVDLPQRAIFTARVVPGTVRISGRVTANRRGIPHVRIHANVAKKRMGGFDLYGRTRADGRFTLIHRLGRGTFFVRVNSYPDQRDVTAGGCAAPSAAAGGCVSATKMILGLQAAPATIRVRSDGSP
jgi:hypothetical protein